MSIKTLPLLFANTSYVTTFVTYIQSFVMARWTQWSAFIFKIPNRCFFIGRKHIWRLLCTPRVHQAVHSTVKARFDVDLAQSIFLYFCTQSFRFLPHASFFLHGAKNFETPDYHNQQNKFESVANRSSLFLEPPMKVPTAETPQPKCLAPQQTHI